MEGKKAFRSDRGPRKEGRNGERPSKGHSFGKDKAFAKHGDAKRPFSKDRGFQKNRDFSDKPFSKKGNFAKDRTFTPRGRDESGERSFSKERRFSDKPFSKDRAFGKGFDKVTPREKRESGENRAFDRKKTPQDKAFSRERGFFKERTQDDARELALRAVNRIFGYGGFSSLVIGEILNESRLSDENRRFFTSLVYSTVENLLLLDFALKKHLEEFEKLSLKMKNIFRLGACQILLMGGVTDYAAVNEMVELTKKQGLEHFSGLVNWGLHRIVEDKDNLGLPDKESDPMGYLSMRYSIPMDFLSVLVEDYGMESIERYLGAEEGGNKTTVRVNKNLLTADELEQLLLKKGWNVEKTRLEGVFKLSGIKNIAFDEDYKQGKYSIQGEESILAAMAVDAKVGQNILDCCAAPGGKTAYMAEQMGQTGRIQAWDKHEHRVGLIQNAAKRLRLYNVRPMIRDAEVFREQLVETMDAVLVDAPCSGTGVIMSKPDIKYHFDQDNLKLLLETQAKILSCCARYVKKGGILVYSTCSILKKENEEQIKRFLAEHPDFVLDRLPDSMPQEILDKQGEFGVSLLPFEGHSDGFFIARLKKV